MNPPSISRTLIVMLMVGLLALGIFATCYAAYMHHDLNEAAKAELTALPIDVGTPGVYEADYVNSFPNACQQHLYLLTHPQLHSDYTRPYDLHGLEIEVSLRTSSGALVCSSRISGDILDDEYRTDTDIPEIDMPRLGRGTYRLSVSVIKGTQSLSGVRQTLVGKYGFCGLESLRANIVLILGLGCLTAAGSIGMAMLIQRRRKSRLGSRSG